MEIDGDMGMVPKDAPKCVEDEGIEDEHIS
jgi:hypothetical protein